MQTAIAPKHVAGAHLSQQFQQSFAERLDIGRAGILQNDKIDRQPRAAPQFVRACDLREQPFPVSVYTHQQDRIVSGQRKTPEVRLTEVVRPDPLRLGPQSAMWVNHQRTQCLHMGQVRRPQFSARDRAGRFQSRIADDPVHRSQSGMARGHFQHIARAGRHGSDQAHHPSFSGLHCDLPLQCGNRVECETAPTVQRARCTQRVVQTAPAADKRPPVDFVSQPADRAIAIDDELSQRWVRFAGFPRPALEYDTADLTDEFSAGEQLAERRVPFIFQRRGKDDLGIARQPQTPRPRAFVYQCDAAHLDVLAASHAYFHPQVDTLVTAVELREMRLELHVMFIGNRAGRLAGGRPQRAALDILQVKPESLRIACCIGGKSGQRLFLPAQRAAPAFADPARQTSIPQHLNLREGHRAGRPRSNRPDLNPSRRSIHCFQTLDLRGQLARHSLTQQKRDQSHLRIAKEACHHAILRQRIGYGADHHALMMRHIGHDRRKWLRSGGTVGSEIQRFPDAVAALRTKLRQVPEIFGRETWGDGQSKRGRIGRHDVIARETALEPESGCAECLVAIAVLGIAFGIGGFGDSPGYSLFAPVPPLDLDRYTLALAQ